MTILQQQLAKKILCDVVIPALDRIKLGGRAAQELVLATGIQESGLVFRRQQGGGPAKGLWQMESVTFYDLWNGFVSRNRLLSQNLQSLAQELHPIHNELSNNDLFAAAMCRVLYRRIHEPLPDAGNVEGQAAYWKKYYNTPAGAGREEDYVKNWQAFINENTFSET